MTYFDPERWATARVTKRVLIWRIQNLNTILKLACNEAERRQTSVCFKLAVKELTPNYYHLLQIDQSATPAEIKAAYHRVLLTSHPDKRSATCSSHHSRDIDIALLREAHQTLRSPTLRAVYDSMLGNASRTPTGPRPAQVISLEEFLSGEDGKWCHVCRCGGSYVISEDQMEDGHHLIGCDSCSEVIWVGYELVEDPQQDQ